jgi:general secretion pathway protein E/type IV pilus assembly protein PilB
MAQLLRFPKTETTTSPRVGERLLQSGCITSDQLHIALHEQRRNGRMLGTTLVELGFIKENRLTEILSERTGLDRVNLSQARIDPNLIRRLPKDVAQRCRAVPLRLIDGTLEIAMADPYDIIAMDEIRRYFPRTVELAPRIATATEIADTLAHYHQLGASLENILHELETGDTTDANIMWEHPVVRLVDTILSDAVQRGASDIHLEPESNFIRMRYRIDGAMQQVRALHNTHWPELSHRLKIMCGMNIADSRSLQDGRFQKPIGGATIDFRVAVMPTAQGENIVLRILDHRRALMSLPQLGFNAGALSQLEKILQRPEGIVLVTGPTGCGKTTTLYAMLQKISSVDVNIMTLEEPIEYKFELIRQTSIQDQQGISFAEGVRGVLRQDPDIIFIGEIRDGDTAQMALRASMTGHQVFSTLHCNDALGALPRLIDLGLHPRMMAGHIGGVIAQRLVRKLCPQCKTMRPATDEEYETLRCFASTPIAMPVIGFAEGQSPYIVPENSTPMIGQAVGCEACHNTGYRGRVAVAEILRMSPALDELVAADAPRSVLFKQARAEGFCRMAEDGIAKVLCGEISLDSLRRSVDLTRAE